MAVIHHGHSMYLKTQTQEIRDRNILTKLTQVKILPSWLLQITLIHTGLACVHVPISVVFSAYLS